MTRWQNVISRRGVFLVLWLVMASGLVALDEDQLWNRLLNVWRRGGDMYDVPGGEVFRPWSPDDSASFSGKPRAKYIAEDFISEDESYVSDDPFDFFSADDGVSYASRDFTRSHNQEQENQTFITCGGWVPEEPEGASLVFIFDDTRSMEAELEHIKKEAVRILDTIRSNPEIRILDYIFVPFNDPEVGPMTKTSDHIKFRESIHRVVAHGGGDCPELTMGGLMLGLQSCRPKSYVYVFTDALAKDAHRRNEVLSLVQRKQAKVDFLQSYFPNCEPMDHPGFELFQDIAEASLGQVYQLNKSDVGKVLRYMSEDLHPDAVKLLSVRKPAPPKDKPNRHEVMVDNTMNKFTVSLTGKNVKFNVTAPKKGLRVDQSPKIESLLNLNNVKVVKVKNPDPGPWTVSVNSDSSYGLRSTAQSHLSFKHGFSTVDTTKMSETNYRPLKDADSFMLIEVSEPRKIQNLTVAFFVNVTGGFIQQVRLYPVPGVIGLYKTPIFKPPNDLFQIRISGYDIDGLIIKRTSSTAIQPQLPEKPLIKQKPIQTALLSGPATIVCHVESGIPFTVEWYKDDKWTGVKQSCNFTCEAIYDIEKVTMESEGRYMCVAKNSAGTALSTQNFTITEFPAIKMYGNLTALKGETILIPCTVYSQYPYNVTWYRVATDTGVKGIPLSSMAGGKSLKNELELKPVRKEDEGWYECEAESMKGQTQGRTYVSVKTPMSISVGSKTKFYMAGDTVELSCNVTGDPQPKIEWRKNDSKIMSNNPTILMKKGEQNVKLLIKSATEEHSGEYTCYASNSQESGSATVQLFFMKKPTVHTEKESVSINEGEDITLQCSATGEPKPKMRWFKNGSELFPGPRISMDRNGNLKITATTSWDAGEFSCRAVNNLGSDSRRITVAVGTPIIFPPVPKDKKMNTHQKGLWPCSELSFPSPKTQWKQRDEVLRPKASQFPQSGAPRVGGMNVHDVNYIPTVENPFGSLSVQIKMGIYGIEKPIPNEVMKLPEMRGLTGGDLTIPCGVTLGNPPGTVHWLKDGVALQKDNRTKIGGNGNLILRGLRASDRGNYLCLVTNWAGNSSRAVNVLVMERPTENITTGVKGQKGGEVVIPCPVNGFSLTMITWTRNGQPLSPSPNIFQDGNGSLVIRNLTEDNSGTYVCIGRNPGGWMSKTISLHVAVPPEFTDQSPQQTLNIVEGYPVILNCNTNAVPKATVHWYKDGKLLQQSSAQSQEQTDLLRFVAKLNDSGLYKCEAVNEAGSTRKEFHVSVLVPPRITGKKSGGSIIARSGVPLTLECMVEGVPSPSILWQQNGMYLTENTSQVTVGSSGQLVLKNVTKDSSGAYVCDAENEAGIMQQTFYVQVRYPPYIKDEGNATYVIRLKEGEEYALPCMVDGNPKPLVLWRKNGFVVHEDTNEDLIVLSDNTLVLLQAEKETSGIYKCEATNEYGSDFREFEVKVLTPPSVLSDDFDAKKKVIEGDPLTLTCPVSNSVPAPTIQWTKDGVPLKFLLQKRSDEAQIRLSDDQRQLTIAEAHPSDRGNYSCTATNSAGRADARFFVDVLMTPHFEEFNHVAHRTILTGGEVALNCSVSGNPRPKVTWRKGKIPVTQDNNPGVHVSLNKQHLTIHSGKTYHSGTYICTAVNEVSRKEREFYVSVLEPPMILTSLHETIDVMAGHNLSLLCPFTGVPEPKVLWLKLDETKTILKSSTDQLEIRNVSCEDSGSYVCEVTNTAGSKSKTFNVTVLEPPVIQPHNINDKLVTHVGGNVNITCKAKGHPQPDITWLHNGQIIKKIRVKRGKRDAEGSKGKANAMEDGLVSLMLANITSDSEGVYTVLASNKAGIVEKNFEVRVLSGPKLRDDHRKNYSISAIQGFPIVLKCPVFGDPPLQIHWFHLGEPLFQKENVNFFGDELHITNSNITHSGDYVCVAVNPIGNLSVNFEVKVIEPPRLNETDTKLVLSVNESVNLSCNKIENGNKKYIWLYRSTPVINSSRVTLTESGEQLTITGLIHDDSGEYTCIASNLAGHARVTYNIQVVEPPGIIRPVNRNRRLSIQLHYPLSIECPITGRPEPNVTWYKDGQEILFNRSDDRIQISGTVLIISDATGEDIGVYKCQAINDAGTKELSLMVDVYVLADWSQWSKWSKCNTSCGIGEQIRMRNCTVDSQDLHPKIRVDERRCTGENVETRNCVINCQIDGGWGSWSGWTPYTTTCGRAVRRRYRSCNNPKPQNNGKNCNGPGVEEYTTFKKCDQIGEWSDWSAWSSCSQTCGWGLKERNRKCVGGESQKQFCPGSSTQFSKCLKQKCKGEWLAWSDWSSCSVTCGRGQRKRHRLCHSEGQACEGENVQVEKCFDHGCENLVPSSANFKVEGKLNGQTLDRRFGVDIKDLDDERLISVSMNDLLDNNERWFPYAQFLMSPLAWSTAYEKDNADNGYSLTKGNYFSLSDIKFATGEGLTVKHKGEGLDPDGALQVRIEVIGEVPLIEPHASVVIQNLDQDFVQTGFNRISSTVNKDVTVKGEKLPFTWDNTIYYNGTQKTMPYLVEKLSTKNIRNVYNPKTQSIVYTSSSSIGRRYEDNNCPRGFEHKPELMHCQDIDECEVIGFHCERNQYCENTFGSFRCACNDGFTAADNATGCLDINECDQLQGLCSHFCHNTPGSYSCSCPYGYYLMNDRRTCKELFFHERQLLHEGQDAFNGGSRLERNNDYDVEENKTYEKEPCPLGFSSLNHECKDRNECEEELNICDDDEICLNTLGSYQCLNIPCPEGFNRDFPTKSCVKHCTHEENCETIISETITFHAVTLTSTYPLQNILQLDVQGQDGAKTKSTKFRVTESSELFRVRESRGRGSLYALRILNKDTLYR